MKKNSKGPDGIRLIMIGTHNTSKKSPVFTVPVTTNMHSAE